MQPNIKLLCPSRQVSLGEGRRKAFRAKELWIVLSVPPQPPSEPQGPSPLALALEWVSRILAAVVVMVGPGLLGQWADARWGTRHWALLGFAVGMPIGLAYLIWITHARNRPTQRNR